ncbi:MAG TPA: helix-hairpin-helix domain-containing protein, partial [Blastocatellia bacterium]|nr:helix-hairpin-helix domain-containing protein [Blastocatellia bacterium]
MDRFEIAAALQEIGLLLKLGGKDQYRSQAYSRAAQAVSGVDGDFADLIRQRRLTEIKGIGDSLAKVIEELHATGRSSLLDTLRSDLPPGVLELSKIPGLTVARIQALNQALGISSVADLKAALEGGKLRDIPGFGAKTEEALREQISRYENLDDRILLVTALKIGERVVEYMEALDEVVSVDLAGSIRRWKETVAIIRVTAGVSKSPERALKHFLQYPPITEVI